MGNLIDEKWRRGILVVDDEPRAIELLQVILKNDGYTNVFSAISGTEALSILQAHGDEIYLILLDIIMPEMSGFDVVKHLANVHPYPVGIIVVSALSDASTASEFFRMGTENVLPMDFISKPVDVTILSNEISKTLNLVHQKRMGYLSVAAKEIHQRLDKIEQSTQALCDILPEIHKKIENISNRVPSFLAQIGLDVVRAILIALAFLALLYLGFGHFLKTLIMQTPP